MAMVELGGSGAVIVCDGFPPGHSRAGGNPVGRSAPAGGPVWIPACAGMTPWFEWSAKVTSTNQKHRPRCRRRGYLGVRIGGVEADLVDAVDPGAAGDGGNDRGLAGHGGIARIANLELAVDDRACRKAIAG